MITIDQLYTDGLVQIDATADDVTYNLLPLASVPNQQLIIQKMDNSAHTLTIVADTSGTPDDTIDGDPSVTISTQWDSVILKASAINGNWVSLSKGGGGVQSVELDVLPAGGMTAALVIPKTGSKVIQWELYVAGLGHYQITDHAGDVILENFDGDSDIALRNNDSEYLVGTSAEQTFTITAMFVGVAVPGYFRMVYLPPV